MNEKDVYHWWIKHDKPSAPTVAEHFGITPEWARQLLYRTGKYIPACQRLDEALKQSFKLHKHWTAQQHADKLETSVSNVRIHARAMGKKLPRPEKGPYKPRGRTAKIVALHRQGLSRPDIAKRLRLDNAVVHVALRRALKHMKDLPPMVDARRI